MATSLPAVWPLGRQAFFIASARTLERNNGSFIAVVEYVVRHMNSSDKYRKLAADCDARAARDSDAAGRAEWHYLARAYRRLAEQADRNKHT